MENHSEEHEEAYKFRVPEEVREDVADSLSDILNKLAQNNLSGEEAKELLRDIINDDHLQYAAGAIEPEADGETYRFVNPLSQFQAAVWVAEAAEIMTYVYAQAANKAGYTWNDIAKAAGYKTGQAAHYKWGRSKERIEAFGENVPYPTGKTWRPQAVPVNALIANPGIAPVAATADDRWKTAAALGRDLGKDPRTIREMASRGELETQKRPPGKDGRLRDLYRVRQ